MKRIRLLVTASALVLSCGLVDKTVDKAQDKFGQKPEVEYVHDIITAAVPLGYAASLAMNAIAGETTSFVHVVARSLDSFPGTALISIDVNDQHPMPCAWKGSGSLMVAGMWSDSSTAVLTVFFSKLSVTEGTFAVGSIALVPAILDNGNIRVILANEDINPGRSDTTFTITLSESQLRAEVTRITTAPSMTDTLSVDQNAWIIEVDRDSTPTVLTDDVYAITGARQYAAISTSTTTAVQLVMLMVQLKPTCLRNPLSGYCLIRTVEVQDPGVELGSALLEFHQTCDGKAKIAVGTGVYVLSTGTLMDLRLGD